jgi:uncharacterized protein (DUF1778 family)
MGKTTVQSLYKRERNGYSIKMNSTKMKRVDLRITQEGKTLIERAAQLKHTTVSAYMLESALQRAREEIDSLERIHLQDADWDVFYAALTNPPEPNQALINLFKDFRP